MWTRLRFRISSFFGLHNALLHWKSEDTVMEKRIELEKRGKNPADVSIFHIFVVIIRIFKVSSFIGHVLKTLLLYFNWFIQIVVEISSFYQYLTFFFHLQSILKRILPVFYGKIAYIVLTPPCRKIQARHFRAFPFVFNELKSVN